MPPTPTVLPVLYAENFAERDGGELEAIKFIPRIAYAYDGIASALIWVEDIKLISPRDRASSAPVTLKGLGCPVKRLGKPLAEASPRPGDRTDTAS